MLWFRWKMEAQAIFLNPLTVCSSSKRKFVIFPYVYKETNGNYPFANGLNTCASKLTVVIIDRMQTMVTKL